MDPRLLCPRLIGREAELERFDTLLEGLPLGAGATLLVSGEAGIGKTALLRELARHAAARGVPLLLGECTVIEARRAFGPFAEILDAAISRAVGGATVEWLERTLPDLARLRGDPRLSDGPVRQREEAERFRVHSGFARLFRTLVGRTPLVLVIDDLQWGDEATLELIPFLSAKLRETPLLIVAAHRPSDAADGGALAAAIAALERDRLSETMTIGPLARADVARVVESTVGLRGAAAGPLLDVLEACEGNPFFVEEVLVGLTASGDLVQRDGRWAIVGTLSGPTVPRSVRGAVQQRMRALGPQVRGVLAAAAVIGQRSDPDLLQRITGASEPELIAALRAAVAAELIVELADGPSATYAFRHALTREAVLADLLKPEQRRLHALIGEQLETADRAHPEDLAYHFDAAGDRERAMRYHEQAADAAMELVAVEAVRRHLDRCVALLPVDDPRRIDLLLRLSQAESDTNDRPAAVRSGEEAYRHAKVIDDRVRMARALLRLCGPRFQLGDTEVAQQG
ncbi:MAG TPA: AAA family ATPase, partial [Candidatus Limnocylindria bacterium]|nr:AAA family ATPase [Candidatus Limnocylindria bacterium]